MVDGWFDGDDVGPFVGLEVGEDDGICEGSAVFFMQLTKHVLKSKSTRVVGAGDTVGWGEGRELGFAVGETEGIEVGNEDGAEDGRGVVGIEVGLWEGKLEGNGLGANEGQEVGLAVG